MRTLTPLTLFTALVLACAATGCPPSGPTTATSAKSKLLMKKDWKINAEAQLKAKTDKQEETTGIKADIKLGGDVGAMADALTAKTLYFGRENGKPNNLVWQITTGQGFLASTETGYWEWNADETKVTLKGTGDTPDQTYTVQELTGTSLVLLNDDGKSAAEHYTTETEKDEAS